MLFIQYTNLTKSTSLFATPIWASISQIQIIWTMELKYTKWTLKTFQVFPQYSSQAFGPQRIDEDDNDVPRIDSTGDQTVTGS